MILDLMLVYDQELRATYNFIQSLKCAYNQRDFTTFFQLLKLRPDSVSHYTIHPCQVLARYTSHNSNQLYPQVKFGSCLVHIRQNLSNWSKHCQKQ